MARFRYEDRIAHPLEDCFLGMRDHMPELVPYLKGVKEIRVVERTEAGPGRIHLVNEWVSGYEPGPLAARFIRPDMRRWLDIVTWDHATYSWEWRIESPAARGVLSAHGTNHMEPDGPAATRFIVEGELEIFVDRLPGLPAFVGRSVRPQVERFIIGLVEPRLRGIDEGLARWLDARKAGAQPVAPGG